MKATVLGIGTELVDGQIVNKNAAWISKQLKDLGLTTSLHLVVPDDRKLIMEALDFCATHGDLMFVTGGLGPTSDDFTRDLISEWSGKPLHFDEDSWQHIKERLEPRGYTVKEIQRQQCYFPEGSQILKNPQGTANAFHMQTKNQNLFVLPGPPREIEAVWDLSIASWLQANTDQLDPFITKYWDTMGVGESDVAMIVEDILKDVQIEKGYRVHLPYVEVKLSFLKSQEIKYAPLIEKITKGLSHCLITQNQEDVTALLSERLEKHSSVSIQDSVTGAFLMNRLLPVSRNLMTNHQWSFSNNITNEKAPLKLLIEKQDEHTCQVSLITKDQSLSEILKSPYTSPLMHERRLQYFAELAMIFWLKHL